MITSNCNAKTLYFNASKYEYFRAQELNIEL